MIADEVGLGEAQYFAAIGTGLEYDETVWNDMLLKIVFEFRHKNFTNARRPPAVDRPQRQRQAVSRFRQQAGRRKMPS